MVHPVLPHVHAHAAQLARLIREAVDEHVPKVKVRKRQLHFGDDTISMSRERRDVLRRDRGDGQARPRLRSRSQETWNSCDLN